MNAVRTKYAHRQFGNPELYAIPGGLGGDAEFLGLGKKAKAKREERREQKREDKQAFKLEKINARGANRVKNTEAGGGLRGLGEGLSGLVGQVFGGGLANQPAENMSYAPEEAPTQNSNKTLIIAGVVLAIGIVVTVFVLKSKKKK